MAQNFQNGLHDSLVACVKRIQRCGRVNQTDYTGNYWWREWCDYFGGSVGQDPNSYSLGLLADFVADVSSRNLDEADVPTTKRRKKHRQAWEVEAARSPLPS